LGDEWLLIQFSCEVMPMASSNPSAAGRTCPLILLALD